MNAASMLPLFRTLPMGGLNFVFLAGQERGMLAVRIVL